MDWKPDKEAKIPVYQQIYWYIKNKIDTGEWTAGQQLPSQRKLAVEFGVNRSTVVQALEELLADGLLEARRGSGTSVATHSWNVLTAAAPDWASYLHAGSQASNQTMIQAINQAEADPRIIRLGTGELSPELLPSKQVWNYAEADAEGFSLGYSEPKGSLRLREAVSKHLAKRGINVSADAILIVSGALQALQLIAVGLLPKNAAILQETPSYLQSVPVFPSAGIQAYGVPLDQEGLLVSRLEYLKRQHRASLLYTNPSFQNPTGTVMSKPRRNALLEACRQVQLPIIEDDVYHDLWLDEPAPAALKTRDKQGLVLYLGSVSKTLGPGLRIGWVAAPEPVVERLADIKMQTDYGASALSQFDTAQWLESGKYEEHTAFIRKVLKKRRDATLEILAAHFSDLADWKTPAGGFYIWLKLKKTVSLPQLFWAALKEDILLNPGSIYDAEDRQHLRISYAYASMDQLAQGLKQTAAIIRKLSPV